MLIVLKSGSLELLKHSGPVQDCNGIALPSISDWNFAYWSITVLGAYKLGRTSIFSFFCKVTQDAGISIHDVKAKDVSHSRTLVLAFTGPRVVIYFYSKANQMHQCFKFILFWNNSTCFGRSFRPPSGIQDCIYSNRHFLSACQQAYSSICLTAVCTVVNS